MSSGGVLVCVAGEQIGVGLSSVPGSATSSLGDSEQVHPLVRASVSSSVKWRRLPWPHRLSEASVIMLGVKLSVVRGQAYRMALPCL